MQCPQCQTVNKTQAKFCKSCGHRMVSEPQPPRRCSRGHIMQPSWDACHLCDTGRRTVEKPAVRLQQTTMEENPHDHLNIRPTAEKMDVGAPPKSMPSSKGVGPPEAQHHRRTMILNENGRQSPSPSPDDGHLVGFLISYSHKTEGEYFALYSAVRYAIGRAGNADISFDQDPLMSESHALLCHTGNHFEYQDNMSTNGSYINGERIDQRMVLNNYDKIKAGHTELLLIMVTPDGRETSPCQVS